MKKQPIKQDIYASAFLVVWIVVGSVLLGTIFYQLSFLLSHPKEKSICTPRVCMRRIMNGPPAYDDVFIAKYLRERYFTPPLAKTIKIAPPDSLTQSGFGEVFDDVQKYIKNYFSGKKGGLFVSLGAGDGVFRDHTLEFEQSFDWTGLLIEPNPKLVGMMVGTEPAANGKLQRTRRAEIASVAVSALTYPMKAPFVHPVLNNTQDPRAQMMLLRQTQFEFLVAQTLRKARGKYSRVSIQSIPLGTILHASETVQARHSVVSRQPRSKAPNVTIDLLILDMADGDYDILGNARLENLPYKVEMAVAVMRSESDTQYANSLLETFDLTLIRVFGSPDKHSKQDFRAVYVRYPTTIFE